MPSCAEVADGGKPGKLGEKVLQWESHMEEEPFQNAAVEVRILLWIIYEGKKSAIDSSCASNGFGL